MSSSKRAQSTDERKSYGLKKLQESSSGYSRTASKRAMSMDAVDSRNKSGLAISVDTFLADMKSIFFYMPTLIEEEAEDNESETRSQRSSLDAMKTALDMFGGVGDEEPTDIVDEE